MYGRELSFSIAESLLETWFSKDVLEVQLIQHGSLAKPMHAPLYVAAFSGRFFFPLVSEVIDAILRL